MKVFYFAGSCNFLSIPKNIKKQAGYGGGIPETGLFHKEQEGIAVDSIINRSTATPTY